MLRFHTATSASGVKNYFSTSDYYSDGQEVVGRWGGTLAAELGLSGSVTKEAFDRLCDNKRPDGSKLTPRTNEFRRVGEDMVFSLPKDVGAAIMLAAPEERDALLAMAEKRAYQVAGMIEADVETRVRRNGAFENRPGRGLIVAGFFHSTARPVDGFAPDPHPHWHLFAFNATRDAEEKGRIKAADFANIYRDRPYYEALFFSLVAKDFADAGLPLERREGGKWGFAGLQAVGNRFSKRTDFIEEEARRLNIADAGRKSQLGAKTRAKKQKELGQEELREDWQAQLTPEEREALDAVLERQAAGGMAVSPAEAVRFALDHCSEKLSVIPERELTRAALLYGIGNVTPEQIEAELAKPEHGLIRDTRDGRAVVTTAELQAEENYIVRQSHPFQQVPPVGVPDGLSRTLPNGKALNDGQWEAVCGLLASPLRVNLIEGPAGAGKSSLLAKYEEGMKLAGESVTYLATTAKAAEVLEHDGFDAHTLARFLVDEKMQAAAKGGRVVVDETSMLGHKDAVRLFQLAETLDLKLICVGDPLQHGSVPRGAFHRLLKTHAHIRPFKLSEIMRQEDGDYLKAAKLLSEGETLAGLDTIAAKGWVKEIESEEERYRSLAAEYVGAVETGRSVLCVSPTHAEAARCTDAIRSALRSSGKLGAEEREFARLVAVDATEAERGQETTYREGDVLQFYQNAKGGIKKGSRLKVASPKAVPLSQAAKFQVFRPQTIRLAEGDKIRFTGTVASLDGSKKFKNGSVATIAGFDARGNIRLSDGAVIDREAGHIRHAFVETSFGSQGQTVKKVILAMAAASVGAMNQEQLYVSATRGKESVSIYTDDVAAMRSAVQRSSQKWTALDLRPKPKAEPEQPARRSGVMDKLREWLERRKRVHAFHRLRDAWGSVATGTGMAAEAANRPAVPQAGAVLGSHPASFTERLRIQQQEREQGYGR